MLPSSSSDDIGVLFATGGSYSARSGFYHWKNGPEVDVAHCGTHVAIRSKGLHIHIIELFSNKSFVDFGEQYLREYYGEAVAREQIAHSAISIERERLRLAGDELDQEVRIPELRDIYAALDTSCLVMCTINACVLAGTEGYIGHYVLVVGYENESIIIHDPGLPGIAYREVPVDLFEMAWGYPDAKSKSAVVTSR